MGEPGGIGPDVTVAAWARRRASRLPVFYCLAAPDILARRARDLGIDCPIELVSPEEAAACFDRALPVVKLDAPVAVEPGKLDPRNAAAVIEAIARAVGDIRSGLASAVVTNPINKKALYDAGFRHPGHTEFLGTLSAAWTGMPGRPVMMLAGPELRAVPVTIHIPLREAAGALSQRAIVETGRIVAADLIRRFGIAAPRLAVAGLNPHAGEGGAHRRRGSRHHRTGGRRAGQGRDRRGRPALARRHVSQGGACRLRRRHLHVSRPGADPGEDAELLRDGQRHPRPRLRAHFARPRHGARYRRQRARPTRRASRRR